MTQPVYLRRLRLLVAGHARPMAHSRFFMSFPITAPRVALLLLALGAAACAPAPVALPPVPTPPPRLATFDSLVPSTLAAVGMDATLGARLDSIVAVAIAERAAAGASVAVGRYGRLVHLAGSGTLDWPAGSPRVDAATMYDLASLTKVVATTTAAMILEEEGRLDLARTVASYVPEFSDSAKAAITVRMLLTHSGGMEAGAALQTRFRGREQYLAEINRRPLRFVPGTQTIYSDWDMVVLQAVIERITGQPLDAFVAERVFRPLGMHDTGFVPDSARRPTIAPTAVDTSPTGLRRGLLQGVVHDGNAWAIGGVSGHAGLFGSARDLAVFAQMLLNGGTYRGVRIVQPATVARWTSRQGVGSSRALGWDMQAPTSSAGRYFSPRSFGHTGFTGTSMWMDPERGVFVVLLANRVHPAGVSTRHVALRRAVADAVQRAVLDAPLVDWESRLVVTP